jgi:hypothetical protein
VILLFLRYAEYTKEVFGMRQNKSYSPEEIQFLKSNYSTMSVADIAQSLGRTVKGVRAKLERLGLRLEALERNNPYPWSDSDIKILKENYLLPDRDIHKLLPNYSVQSICNKRLSLGLRKELGKPYDNRGYYEIVRDGKRQWVHRMVVEQRLGRKLSKVEKVHHIDGNKLNNSPDNLYLCSGRRHHGLVHASLEQVAFGLYKQNVIGFNHATGEYFIK